MKTVIVVFSDPKSGTDEALGRLFNALFLALELRDKQQDVTLVFQGAGTRWLAELAKTDHAAHALYESVQDKVLVCGGWADVFGATAAAEMAGARVVRDREIPGVGQILDLSRYLDENARLLMF